MSETLCYMSETLLTLSETFQNNVWDFYAMSETSKLYVRDLCNTLQDFYTQSETSIQNVFTISVKLEATFNKLLSQTFEWILLYIHKPTRWVNSEEV